MTTYTIYRAGIGEIGKININNNNITNVKRQATRWLKRNGRENDIEPGENYIFWVDDENGKTILAKRQIETYTGYDHGPWARP